VRGSLPEFRAQEPDPKPRQRTSDSVRFGFLSRPQLSTKSPERAQQLPQSRSYGANNDGSRYHLDPEHKAADVPGVQKGDWEPVRSGNEPPALARTWRWVSHRKVGTTISETAFSGSDPRFDPTWNIHFGIAATRPTFGRLKGEIASHAAVPTLAENMSMDQTMFSPFRTVTPSVNPGTAGGTRRSSAPDPWSEAGKRSPLSSRAPTRPFSRQSGGASPLRLGSPPGVGQGHGPDFGSRRLVSRGSQASSVAKLEDGKLVMTRSCTSLDGYDRSVVVLPASWAHVSKNIRSEKVARALVSREAQLQVLHDSPGKLMRALNSHMRTHPDSAWQYMCMQ
jgi:hypothetical protein